MDEPRAAAGVPVGDVEDLARGFGTTPDTGRRITVLGTRRHVGTTLTAITLARALAKNGRVVLVDLALAAPNLAVIATDSSVPGISEVVLGSASFGQIITRDRFSRAHVITAGRMAKDAQAVLSSQRLAITLEALGRSYDYVVVDAGALPDISPERFAQLAPRAVLVTDSATDPATESARQRLLGAGFANVSLLASAPDGPTTDAGKARTAA
jgi:Mrp family chromosome partitioning ATPase